MPILARLFLVLSVIACALPARAEGLDAGIDQAFEINKIDPAGAVDFLAKSLAAAEETKDEDPYLMAEGYFYLGRFRYDAQALPEAEEALRRTLELIDSLGEQYKNDGLKIDAMEYLGQVVGRQQRLGNAVTIFNRVLQMQAAAKSRTHPDRLRSMQFMAITFEAGQSWRAAEYYWRTALGVALDTGLAEEDVAYYRESLARNLDSQSRTDEAVRIRGGERVIDLEGALLADIQAGEALRKEEKYEEAHAHYLKLRADYAASAGDSMLYMLVLKDVAETGDAQQHAEQAKLYEEAVAIQDRLFGLEPTGSGNGEFHYLAAREWAFEGEFTRAFKGFDDLDGLGNWVGGEVKERQRAVRTIMKAALREPDAAAACATPAETRNAFEILYAGYVIEQAFASIGRNQARVPALDCAIALVGGRGEGNEWLATLMALGMALIDTAEYERAIEVEAQALAYAEETTQPPHLVRLILAGMALAHAWTRGFDEALALVDRAESIDGADDIEKLTLLRIRAITLINATRYLEAEDVLAKALALADTIPPSGAFDDDRASTLNDLALVLRRAGRNADALAILERIVLPETLPADATPSQTIFYLDIKQELMGLRFSLEQGEEAMQATAAFRDAAVPVVDRLLANPERNVIMAATIASIMTTGALTLSALELHDEANTIASKAAELIAADQSEGVRLLAARNEFVQALSAMIRGDLEAALPRFDGAIEAGRAILPDDSDEMLEIWAGRGIARLGMARLQSADPTAALEDLRRATEIAKVRIARETRFDSADVQRKLRPSFEQLVGSAWLTGRLQ